MIIDELEEDEVILEADKERQLEKDAVSRSPADASLVDPNQNAYGLTDIGAKEQVIQPAQPRQGEAFTPEMLARPEEDVLEAPLIPEESPIREITTPEIKIEGRRKKPVEPVMARKTDFAEVVPEADLITGREQIAPMIKEATKHQQALEEKATAAELQAIDLEAGAQENKLAVVEDLHTKIQDLTANRNRYIKEKRRSLSSKAEEDSKTIPKSEKNRTSLMIAGFLSGLGAGLLGRTDDFGSWLNSRLAVEAKKSALVKRKASDLMKSGLKEIDVEDKYLKERITEIKMQRYKEIDVELAGNIARAKSPKVIAKLEKARAAIQKQYSRDMVDSVKYQIKGYEDTQKKRFEEGSRTGVIRRQAPKVMDQSTRDRIIRWGKDRIVVDSRKQKETMDQFLPTVATASELMFNMLSIQEEIGPTELTQRLPLTSEEAARYKSYQKQLLGLIGQAKRDGGLGIYPAGVLQEWDLKAMGDIATTGIGIHSKRILRDLLKNTSTVYRNVWKGMGIDQGQLPPEMRFKGLTRGLMRKARKATRR